MSGGRWIGGSEGVGGTLRFIKRINKITTGNLQRHQSGAAEAWWAHNPQVPGSKPGSDMIFLSCFLFYLAPYVNR